jgi:predicted transcriptional regulator
MKIRSKVDIYADVFRVATGGIKKTRIVYGANLNFVIVKRYLSELIDLGLLEARDGLYRTTERGPNFLEHYNDLASILIQEEV